MDRTSPRGGRFGEPALTGRVLFATGLLASAWFFVVDPDPSLVVTVLLFAAPAAAILGGLLMARALESRKEGLTRRVLGAAGAGVPAGLALREGGLVFASSTETSLLFVGLALGAVAYGLLFSFVHGVHRALRPGSSPLLLWAALASVGAGLIVALAPVSNLLESLLIAAGPLALMAVTVLWPSDSVDARSPG